jgi:ATP-dependent helicase/nuclease subunit A
MTAAEPHDAAARRSITEDTDRTLFVNAGAGSGKTSALVRRVRTLVLVDGVRLANIAAVTFTEKAGAELRDRLRAEFERAYRDDGAERERAEQALDDLDSAPIGTLHAFAQRILAEHPIEAGLPPLIEVRDEVGSSVAFEERWAGLQTELLDDDAIAEPLLLALAAGAKLDHIRSLTQLLTNDWDLIESHVLAGPEPVVNVPDVAAAVAEFVEYLTVRDHCTDVDDKLLANLDLLAAQVDRLTSAVDLESQLPQLLAVSRCKLSFGKAAAWASAAGGKPAVVQRGKELCDEAGQLVVDVLDSCLRVLTRWTARKVLDDAQVRRGDGRLEFHDLLVLARDLLRHDSEVRAALHDDYQRVLLDEFQDTDSIQIEIAARICGGREAEADDWREVAIAPGRLFVVGDAKQSIYRFRRASIRTYLDARQTLGGETSLTTNFRTVAPILDWVNGVFGELIQAQDGAQPEYEPLRHHRVAAGEGPAVTVLGEEAHLDRPNAATLREREAADVAGSIRSIIASGWTVQDGSTGEWRPARHEDIAVLVPARTSLPFLTDALDSASIPFRAEASSLVYQAEEVRALLAAARAVADATDALSLVTALRSPLFGCGDDDLWVWKRDGGRFSLRADVPEELAASPVGRAMEYLKRLSYESRWLAPSELLGRIVADRRVLEVAATAPRRARDEWRRLRFVVDQARAWSEVSHGGLRAYLAWAARQGQETTRVAEAVLPETDAASVRVLTVHAAKGLEFPIVIMSGMSSMPNTRYGVALLWTDDGYEVRTRKGVQTQEFDAVQPIDEQMGDLERLRLLYVAATRARDHLVISLHRDGQSNARTSATTMAATSSALVGAERFELTADNTNATRTTDIVEPPPGWDSWLAGIEAARAATRVHPAITASGLEGTEPDLAFDEAWEPGAAKGPRDLELPPWTKGRYGSAIGRAVHGVLQTIDLVSGAGLDESVAAQAVAEGVVGQEDMVAGLVRSALQSEVVKHAAGLDHWREMYVGTVRDDGTVLEGYIDLVYREVDGSLMIVDYKTDAVPTAALPSRVTFYRPQMDAYVEALDAATGGTSRATLVFLHPTAPATATSVGMGPVAVGDLTSTPVNGGGP